MIRRRVRLWRARREQARARRAFEQSIARLVADGWRPAYSSECTVAGCPVVADDFLVVVLAGEQYPLASVCRPHKTALEAEGAAFTLDRRAGGWSRITLDRKGFARA